MPRTSEKSVPTAIATSLRRNQDECSSRDPLPGAARGLGDRLAGLVVGPVGVGATTYGFALEAAKAKAREIGATDIVVLP